jgi:hypothetical protein
MTLTVGLDKTYRLRPVDKNAIYTTEHWSNTLSTGNRVELLYTQIWRSGSFVVELSEDKKTEIAQGGGIAVKDLVYEVEDLNDGWYECHEILAEDSFTEEELCEIKTLQTNSDCEMINSDILEENGWMLDNTVYEIISDCAVRLMEDAWPEEADSCEEEEESCAE